MMDDPDQPLIAVRIKDGIFVGNVTAAHDEDFLLMNKVTRMVNCAGGEVRDIFRNGAAMGGLPMAYLTFPWRLPQGGAAPVSNLFDQGGRTLDSIVRFVDEALAQGECVVIHSYHGISRACAICVAYLMRKYGWTLQHSMDFVAMAHQDMAIDAAFRRQLDALSKAMDVPVATGGAPGQRVTAALDAFHPEIDDSAFSLDSEQWMLRNSFVNGLVGDSREASELAKAASARVLVSQPFYVTDRAATSHARKMRRRITFCDTRQGTAVASAVTSPEVKGNTAPPAVIAPQPPPAVGILSRPGTPLVHRIESDPPAHVLLPVSASGRQQQLVLRSSLPQGTSATAPSAPAATVPNQLPQQQVPSQQRPFAGPAPTGFAAPTQGVLGGKDTAALHQQPQQQQQLQQVSQHQGLEGRPQQPTAVAPSVVPPANVAVVQAQGQAALQKGGAQPSLSTTGYPSYASQASADQSVTAPRVLEASGVRTGAGIASAPSQPVATITSNASLPYPPQAPAHAASVVGGTSLQQAHAGASNPTLGRMSPHLPQGPALVLPQQPQQLLQQHQQQQQRPMGQQPGTMQHQHPMYGSPAQVRPGTMGTDGYGHSIALRGGVPLSLGAIGGGGSHQPLAAAQHQQLLRLGGAAGGSRPGTPTRHEDPYAALQLRPGGAYSMSSFSRQGSGASAVPDANATISRPGAGTPAPGPMRPSSLTQPTIASLGGGAALRSNPFNLTAAGRQAHRGSPLPMQRMSSGRVAAAAAPTSMALAASGGWPSSSMAPRGSVVRATDSGVRTGSPVARPRPLSASTVPVPLSAGVPRPSSPMRPASSPSAAPTAWSAAPVATASAGAMLRPRATSPLTRGPVVGGYTGSGAYGTQQSAGGLSPRPNATIPHAAATVSSLLAPPQRPAAVTAAAARFGGGAYGTAGAYGGANLSGASLLLRGASPVSLSTIGGMGSANRRTGSPVARPLVSSGYGAVPQRTGSPLRVAQPTGAADSYLMGQPRPGSPTAYGSLMSLGASGAPVGAGSSYLSGRR
jgi:hypothetical protein